MSETSLASALFSNVQQRLLALIFGNADSSFYMAEMVKRLQSGTGAVAREVARLQKSGLVTVETIGNQKHYRANRQSPIFEELRGIVEKTIGLKEPLGKALAPHAGRIKAAFIFGSIAKKTDSARSDIDLMVIGNGITYSELYKDLAQVEKALGRPINPTIFETKEWKRKRGQKNSFLEKVASQPKIFLIGSESDLET